MNSALNKATRVLLMVYTLLIMVSARADTTPSAGMVGHQAAAESHILGR